jgi:hypothetical protein
MTRADERDQSTDPDSRISARGRTKLEIPNAFGTPQWSISHHPRFVSGRQIRAALREQPTQKFMKPTPQITTPFDGRRFSRLLTDWNYQSKLETSRAVGKTSGTTDLQPIWKLSANFFGAESSRSFVRELLAMAGLSILAGWQVYLALVWMIRVAN